jgi:hypothetical protein
MSWSPETDAMKEKARSALNPGSLETFDLLAPATTHTRTQKELEQVETIAARLAEAAASREPLLDPGPYLPRVPVPVFLAHGKGDRLMPWTEVVRLERALGSRIVASGITSLFSHSFGEKRWPTPGVVLEAVRFLRLIRRMLRLV